MTNLRPEDLEPPDDYEVAPWLMREPGTGLPLTNPAIHFWMTELIEFCARAPDGAWWFATHTAVPRHGRRDGIPKSDWLYMRITPPWYGVALLTDELINPKWFLARANALWFVGFEDGGRWEVPVEASDVELL